jgi:hypothetical protein
MLKRLQIVSVSYFLIAVLLLLEVSPVYAEELAVLYRGIRPLGMGNAFTAVSSDENALFYNPAGLKLSSAEKKVALVNPLLEVSDVTLDLNKDYTTLNKNSPSEVSNFLGKRIGEQHHLRASLFPHIAVPPFAIGILTQVTADIAVRNPVFPEMETNVRTDIGLLVGGARDFGRGLLGGMTVKYIQREGIVKTYTATDILNGTFHPENDFKKDADFAFDLGGMAHLSEWTPLQKWDPIAGIVLQNITDLDFGEVGVHPMQLNIGVAIHPEIGWGKSTIAFDLVDLTRRVSEDNDLGKRTHLGAEFKFKKIVSARLGFNQGYFTGGLTFDFWFVQLDVATFAEELGASFKQRKNRRTVAQLSFGF